MRFLLLALALLAPSAARGECRRSLPDGMPQVDIAAVPVAVIAQAVFPSLDPVTMTAKVGQWDGRPVVIDCLGGAHTAVWKEQLPRATGVVVAAQRLRIAYTSTDWGLGPSAQAVWLLTGSDGKEEGYPVYGVIALVRLDGKSVVVSYLADAWQEAQGAPDPRQLREDYLRRSAKDITRFFLESGMRVDEKLGDVTMRKVWVQHGDRLVLAGAWDEHGVDQSQDGPEAGPHWNLEFTVEPVGATDRGMGQLSERREWTWASSSSRRALRRRRPRRRSRLVVSPEGVEPSTNGLRVRCSAS